MPASRIICDMIDRIREDKKAAPKDTPATHDRSNYMLAKHNLELAAKIGELESTLAAEREEKDRQREQLHAKFGFVPAKDDPAKCACAYCTKDFEAIADMCAEYECAIELPGGYKATLAAERASRLQAEAALLDARRFVKAYCGPESGELAAIDAALAKPSVSPEQEKP